MWQTALFLALALVAGACGSATKVSGEAAAADSAEVAGPTPADPTPAELPTVAAAPDPTDTAASPSEDRGDRLADAAADPNGVADRADSTGSNGSTDSAVGSGEVDGIGEPAEGDRSDGTSGDGSAGETGAAGTNDIEDEPGSSESTTSSADGTDHDSTDHDSADNTSVDSAAAGGSGTSTADSDSGYGEAGGDAVGRGGRQGGLAEPEPETTATTESTAQPPATADPPDPSASPRVTDLDIEAAVAVAELRDTTCPEDSVHPQVRCRVAVLPLRYDSPGDGETVEILFAQVNNGDPSGIGPVVFIQGGPGIGGLVRADRFVGTPFDMIVFDQRGTGRSQPKLECGEVEALWALERTNVEADRVGEDTVFGAYEDCADRLRADGVDFGAFHTDYVAADLEVIRRLLDLERWSLWGVSYGTRVALTVLRDHPHGVRAAALDSIVPFEVDFFASIPRNGLRAMRALDAACDVDSCANDHGDLLNNLVEQVERLDQDPIVIDVTRPVTGERFPFRVSGADLLDLVFIQLYSTHRLVSLPRQVDRAEFGGVEELVAGYVTRRDPNRLDLATALYYTTWCREEFPFHDPTADDDIIAEGVALFGPAFEDALSAEAISRVCGYFDVAPGPDYLDEPLVSDVPTLVLAGAFDPITPPEWSRQVADAFTNATYVELGDHGHGMATACPIGLRDRFLLNPGADLDLGCVVDAPAPDFD